MLKKQKMQSNIEKSVQALKNDINSLITLLRYQKFRIVLIEKKIKKCKFVITPRQTYILGQVYDTTKNRVCQ